MHQTADRKTQHPAIVALFTDTTVKCPFIIRELSDNTDVVLWWGCVFF